MAPYSVGPVYRVLPVSSGSASLTEPLVGFHSPPRRTEHADAPPSSSCPLRKKVYGTQPIGCAFNPVVTSIYSTSSNRFRLPLPVYPLSQVLQITERFYQTPLPPVIARGITEQLGPFAPCELPQFIATPNPSDTFSPSFPFPV